MVWSLIKVEVMDYIQRLLTLIRLVSLMHFTSEATSTIDTDYI